MAELPDVVTQTELAIWSGLEAAEVRHENHPRLSASALGNECERALWYDFRWAVPAEVFDGRKLSIFETGNVWEDRLVEYLRKAGMDVSAVFEPTGEQYRVAYAWGHGSGRTDGKVLGVPEAPKTVHLFEAKSSNQKGFLELKRKGLREGKPMHYTQVQTYLHLQGLTRCLYICVNKNDDSLFVERVDYDAPFAIALMAKAERVVSSNSAPTKLHDDPEAKMAFQCRSMCNKRGVCHDGQFARRHCRTCIHATAEPDGDGRWSCARHLKDLTPEEQAAGCANHLYTPSLVPGAQIDADEAGEWVEYRMADGSHWKDGAAA